jgi:hypothetical protein
VASGPVAAERWRRSGGVSTTTIITLAGLRTRVGNRDFSAEDRSCSQPPEGVLRVVEPDARKRLKQTQAMPVACESLTEELRSP